MPNASSPQSDQSEFAVARDRNGLLPGMSYCPRHGDYTPARAPWTPACPVCVYGKREPAFDDQEAKP